MVKQPVRMLLSDAQPVFRRGLRALLDERRNMVIVGEARDDMEAVRLVGEA